MRGNVSMVRMSKPPGVTLLDHRRPAPVRTYPDTRRRAVTCLTALFRRQTGLYRARARTAAASKQRSPLIKPSTNDYYLRTGEVPRSMAQGTDCPPSDRDCLQLG